MNHIRPPKYNRQELAVLRRYPELGLEGVCANLGPHRTLKAVRAKLTMMGFITSTSVMYTRKDAWTDEEYAILDRVYPLEGFKGCLPLLPLRSKHAILSRAKVRGLLAPRTVAGLMPKPVRAPILDEEEDDGLPVRRFLSAGAWRIDHHVPPVSVFGLGGV